MLKKFFSPTTILPYSDKKASLRYFNQSKTQQVIIIGNQKAGTSVITALLGKATGKKFTIDPFFKIKNQIEIRKKLYNFGKH